MAYRAGFVALIGKPNVGKSTLLNAIVGQKVSIVSNKPQTTRRRVLGIAQGEGHQVAFIDTPGIHEPHTKLGRAMVEAARASLSDIDLILFVADGSGRPGEMDKQIASMLRSGSQGIPILLCLNKMDLLKAENVEANVTAYCELLGTDDYMLTTATRGINVDKLMAMILERLPEGDPMFPEDEYTDQSTRFMASEIIREKILAATRQEVPHATAVFVDSWEDDDERTHIRATIVVEKQGQKAILIGQKGAFLKDIGTRSRLEIEEMLGRKVFLELFVKVREDWRQNPRMLQEMEYVE
ncbi:MAG TPA: GTPase Era [Fimbriimonadaceae bacterium]|nr:GTPase Era [Fimbriimonadaceae bacterium]